jgi:hypothetical protein
MALMSTIILEELVKTKGRCVVGISGSPETLSMLVA